MTDGPLLCGFNMAMKGLIITIITTADGREKRENNSNKGKGAYSSS